MVVNTINQSFTEVYNIIVHMNKELYSKIPKEFIEVIKSEMDLRL